jgi:hypothetical protein
MYGTYYRMYDTIESLYENKAHPKILWLHRVI